MCQTLSEEKDKFTITMVYRDNHHVRMNIHVRYGENTYTNKSN